jgi:hypothetical protein
MLGKESLIVKMDIEGAEWQALRYLPLSYLDRIDQLVMEVHIPVYPELSQTYWGNIDIINSLK